MKIVGILQKIVEIYRLKKILFCVYKMIEITKETWEKDGE